MRNDSQQDRLESSAEKINYLVRPAKQIERKLIVEALSCLTKHYSIQNYQYIGMGSLFFVDFQMFHKYLGIKSMISLEMNEDKIDRFIFNKPYDFIKLIPGFTTDILPTLDWKKDLFIWLDYDSRVSRDMISDIQIVSNYISAGGMLIITIDAEPRRFQGSESEENGSSNKQRLENLKKQLHPYFPTDITLNDLARNNFPALLNRIITNAIEEKLLTRELKSFQIFNFRYKDSSQMYTFGCIFDRSAEKLENCGIYGLEFVSKDSTIIDINVPIVTPLEKLHFDRLIPGIASKLKHFKMDKKKLTDYENYYKYYPQYFEVFL